MDNREIHCRQRVTSFCRKSLLDTSVGDPHTFFGNILCRLIVLLTGATCLLAAVLAIWNECRNLSLFSDLSILVLVLCFSLLCLIFFRIPLSKGFCLSGVLTACFLARLLYILLIPTEPFSDFSLLYQASMQAASGDFSWAHTNAYFFNWAYQIPFILYQAGVLKLFGSIWALKVMNLLFMTGIDFLIYAIARRIVSDRAAICAALLYAVFPSSFHMASVLTNQHISTFLMLLAIYILLSIRSVLAPALAGLIMCIGNLMRPEGIVLIAALLVCLVCVLISIPSRKNALRYFIGLVSLLAVYFLFREVVEQILYATNVAPYGIGNNVPEWKFVLGLDFTGPYGGYSEKNIYILDIADQSARRAETVRIIKDSLQESNGVIPFFFEKLNLMWGVGEDYVWSSYGMSGTSTVAPGISLTGFLTILHLWERAVYILVWILAAAGCFLSFKKRINSARLFCSLMICATFCVYLLIEVQSRYRYFIMPFVFILASVSADQLFAKQKNNTGF